ncbi:MAG: hypothetical protein Q9159_006823 [Coniocarpon cinnabarinum]
MPGLQVGAHSSDATNQKLDPQFNDNAVRRNRKLKCDRGRPCGQCTKAGRPSECHYDQTAGSMSRVDTHDDEPMTKRRRLEDGDSANGYSPNGWNMNTPASVQYGAYGNALMMDGANQRNGNMGALNNQQAATGAQQAYMGGQNQRLSEASDGNMLTVSGARAGDKVGVVEDLQARVARLERMMKLENGLNEEEEAQTSKTGAAEVLVDLRHSHSSAMNPKRSIMQNFDDMKNFYTSYVDTSTGMDEVHRLRTLFPKSKQPTRIHTDAKHAMASIVEMIPPQGDCNRLLHIYLRTWDPVHSILDVASFLNEYDKYWRQSTDPHHGAFAPTLLLVIAIGSSLDDASQSQNPNFLNDAISYVETWLNDLSNKRQKDIEVLCVHALLVIAMQSAGISQDRIYRVTGALARSAMLMGLHYDPRVVPHKADERHIQHRRCLWTSIVELDLQASLQCGTPPAVRDTDLRPNATVLANIPPDTLSTNSPQQTMSRSNGVDQSQQHSTIQFALAKTLRTRLLTGTLTIDVYPHHDFALLRQQVNNDLPPTTEPNLSNMIADTYIQRSVCAITRAQVKGQKTRVMEGCLSSVHASMSVLGHLSQLDPTSGNGFVSKRRWNLFVNLFGFDIYRSALVLCFARKMAYSFPPFDGSIGDFSSDTLISTAEATLNRLLRNLDDFGNHIRDLLAVTLALACVRPESQKDDATKWNAMKSGFDYLKQQLFARQPVVGTGPVASNFSGNPDTSSAANETSPQTASSSGLTPLGSFDLQFLANSFNFDFDFGMGLDAGIDAMSGQQTINFGGM